MPLAASFAVLACFSAPAAQRATDAVDVPKLASEAAATDPALAIQFDYCATRDADPLSWTAPRLEPALAARAPGLAAAHASAVATGLELARTAGDPAACGTLFERGSALVQASIDQVEASLRERPVEFAADETIRAEQEALGNLFVADQAARYAYIAFKDKTGEPALRWARAVAGLRTAIADAAATDFMRSILDRYDWVDTHRFGEDFSHCAWLLMQHADAHPDLQAVALARMEPYLESGGVDRGNFAYLWDRVAVNHGRPQRYGTQPDWNCVGGKMKLMPLEDPENVNARRAEMGLSTVEAGLARMEAETCR